MDRPAVLQISQGRIEQGEMEITSRNVIYGTPTTLAVKISVALRLELTCDRFATALRPLCDRFVTTLRQLCDRFATALQLNADDILVTFL